jgi:hypothetical protein
MEKLKNSINNKPKYVYFETISTSFPLKINGKFERVTDWVLKCTILDFSELKLILLL